MSGAFPCCEHCHAAPEFRGSHATSCGTKGCPGSEPTFRVAPKRRLALLLTIAVVLYVAGAILTGVTA